MSGRAYSTRLMQTFGTGSWSWTVPAGRRAVLRSINMVNTHSGEGWTLIHAAGAYVYYRVLPGSAAVTPVDCRVVLYEGEVLGIQTDGVACSVTLSGFLFTDVEGPDADGPQQLPVSPTAPFPDPDFAPSSR